jgi:hypothetical protein
MATRHRPPPVDDLTTIRAERLTVRANTLRSMRQAITDLTDGARMEGWPLESVNFAVRARRELGNAEAVIRAQVADLLEPLGDGLSYTINLRGEHL